jgi:hypothetical protein
MAQDQNSNNLAINGVVLAALFSMGGLIAAHIAPLKGERPQASVAQLHDAASGQDVEARLWQDPFSVVAAAPASESKPCGDKHGVDHCKKPVDQLWPAGERNLASLKTLWVTISGAPYFMEEEQRRRTRYAVVSALDARGFSPLSATQLGYYVPTDFPQSRIPFELFESQRKQSCSPKQGDSCKVLVLWMNEDILGATPGARLDSLAQNIGGPDAVIGPQTSGTLKNLIVETNGKNTPGTFATSVPFYSYGATAARSELNGAVCPPGVFCPPNLFAPPNVFRTVANDKDVAVALSDELRLRGLDSCANGQAIVTISEFDTIYGRSLPRSVEMAFKDFRKNLRLPCPGGGSGHTRFLHRTYLRGLDGERAELEASKETKKKAAAKTSGAASDKDAETDEKTDEKPFGLGQKDYLRRLAADLKHKEASGDRVVAVGVLGTDVFDKLMILRALRPEFPEALFFTTDYDAALGIKNELDYTRNLVIASSFGPSLRSGLQGDIPPFRDSYETSAFLATQIAIEHALHGKSPLPCIPKIVGKLAKEKPARAGREKDDSCPGQWAPKPRLFELTRAGDFFELPRRVGAGDEAAPSAGGAFYPASLNWLLFPASVGLVYALASFLTAWREKWRGIVAAKVLLIALGVAFAGILAAPHVLGANVLAQNLAWLGLALFIVAVGSWFGNMDGDLRTMVLAMFWPAAALLVSSFLLVVVAMTKSGNYAFLDGLIVHGLGEPISLLGGVSMWPALALRLFALLLSIWLIPLALVQLDNNFKKTCKLLGLVDRKWDPQHIVNEYSKSRRFPAWLNPSYFYRIAPETDGQFNIDEKEWKRIVLVAWPPHRIARVLLFWIVISFALLLVLFSIFGPPFDPSRGELFRELFRRVTILDVFSMWFLVFVVVDATLFLSLFVWRLSHSQTRWPEVTRNRFILELGLAVQAGQSAEARSMALTEKQENILDDWIDIQFIAQRTSCINSLVWFPFVIISLLIFSRSGLFANFPLSWPIIIAQGVSLFLIFGCAFALNWFAEGQRRRALGNLRDEITRARNADEEALAKKWEGMRERVTDLREGSFRNFLQQPVVTGMLLPLASIGGPQFIEQFRLFGL